MTARFKIPVINNEGYDFRIDGNAHGAGAEPGVVWVSADVNSNGLPDDPWYEIWGSEQRAGRSTQGYTVCYHRPATSQGDSRWTASDGASGFITHNNFHQQSYYPLWYKGDSISFTGTLLPQNMSHDGKQWIMTPFEYGYVDNLPNSDVNSSFDIDWAVNADGTPASLTSINFIRIQVGVIGCNSITGEESTEITSIINLNKQ